MSLKQRLYPTEEQTALLRMHTAHARFIYNIALEQRSMWTPAKRYFTQKINFATQSRQVTELRKEVDWLRAGSTVVQQGALSDLDAAFQRFFDGHAKYPTFKSSTDREGGFTVRDLSVRRINRKWARILIPKVGWVKFRLTYPWHEAQAATGARATLRNNHWHVSLTTPARAKALAGTGRSTGIDRGVTNTIATSDEALDTIPGLSAGEQRRFLALERRLSRQTKGSNRRQSTLEAMARLRGKLTNRRTDWIEQHTTRLARTYDLAVLENLPIGNMTARTKPKPDPENPGSYLRNGAAAKSGLNRVILASCWGKFATRLEHKMAVLKVNPANTSRECRICKHVSPENRKSQADFECVNCGHGEHADINAAKNILGRATSTTPTRGQSGARATKPRKRASTPTKHPTAAQAA